MIKPNYTSREIDLLVDNIKLKGDLTTLHEMKALIVFAHGSGSSRKSSRNQQVAHYLNRQGFGTLLFDLLTEEEAEDRQNVFDIKFLSHRLKLVTRWLQKQKELSNIPVGYFGASTGAAAAIQAASKFTGKNTIYAIVSRGGRPDLAGPSLRQVKAPTLLIVGSLDYGVVELNEDAHRFLKNSEISIVPGATHLFEEAGTLEEVAKLASQWFNQNLERTGTKIIKASH